MPPKHFRPILLCGFTVLLALAAAKAESPDMLVYQRALRAAAWVVTPTAQGTGFLVDRSNRLLVTNQHVVRNHDTAKIFFPIFSGNYAIGDRKYYVRYDRPISGRVVARDPERDLA